MVRHTTFRNPYPGMEVNVAGSALVHGLEKRHPRLAAEFTGLFSHVTDRGPRSIVGVGAKFRIQSQLINGALIIRLLNDGVVEKEASFPSTGTSTYFEHLFLGMSAFFDEVRSFLVEHHELPPTMVMLGGWQCVSQPEWVGEPLVFTIPRITCWLDEEEWRICHFLEGGEGELTDNDLLGMLPGFSPTVVPRVVQKQDVPGCREYVDTLVDLITELSAEASDKVVICREVKFSLKKELSPVHLLRLVAPKQMKNYEYMFRWSGGDAWVGISPETLVRKNGAKVVVEPMAGTRKGSDAQDKWSRYRDELLSDDKERVEHETAARMFYENLGTVCQPDSLEVLQSRGVVDFGYVQHLKSIVAGTVKPGVNIFRVLASVYPPATIWGKPVLLSGERIRNYERIERGFFTGGLGYVTLDDHANLALAIRTARLCGNEVHVYAGSGIVKASDPYQEWLETSNKMAPFLQSEVFDGSP